MWSDWLVFCDYGFSVSALWCPLATPTVLLGFLLPWTWGLSSGCSSKAQPSAPYLGRGVAPLSCGSAPLQPPRSSLAWLKCHIRASLPLDGVSGKEPACQWRKHAGLIPGSGRSPGNSLATHSSIVAWRIPWTEEPGGLHGLTQCRTWLKQLSMHAHMHSNVVSRCQLWWHISSTCFIPIIPVWITRLFCESFILIYLSVCHLKIHESIDKRCSLILVVFSFLYVTDVQLIEPLSYWNLCSNLFGQKT